MSESRRTGNKVGGSRARGRAVPCLYMEAGVPVCWSDCAHRAPPSSLVSQQICRPLPGLGSAALELPWPMARACHYRFHRHPAMLHTRDPTESRLDSSRHLFPPEPPVIRPTRALETGLVGPPICTRVRWHIVTEAGQPVWQTWGAESRSAQRLRGFLPLLHVSVSNRCPMSRCPPVHYDYCPFIDTIPAASR